MTQTIRPRTSTTRVLVFGLATSLGLLAAAGCSTYTPGGSGFSDDAFTYPSTPHLPATLNLVDTRTGQTIWSYEIPVGHQLTVRFFDDRHPEDPNTPADMSWEDMEIGTAHGYLDNTMQVPAADSRRLEPVYRDGPEMATAGSAAAPK